MKELFVSGLIVLFVATAQAQVNFTGIWVFKQVVSDSTRADGIQHLQDIDITKVADEYYRMSTDDSNLLFKLVKDSTLYSNFSPNQQVTVIYNPDNTLQVTTVYKKVHDDHNHGADEHDHHDHGNETQTEVLLLERKKN
jgi:hypothetical protein